VDNSTRSPENKCHPALEACGRCQTFVIKVVPVYVAGCRSDEFDGCVVASGFQENPF